MANAYFGNGYQQISGAWNTVANWYSALGNGVTGKGAIPAVPLGRLPDPALGDTVVVVAKVVTGPTGTYTGPIQISYGSASPYGQIQAGSYSGTVTSSQIGGVSYAAITGGSFSGAVVMNGFGGISGGTFNGPSLTLSQGNLSGGTVNCPVTMSGGQAVIISGGTINGLITVSSTGYQIAGGAYNPPIGTLTLIWNGHQPSVSGFINDPGFARLGSGHFNPTYTYVGFNSGGGADDWPKEWPKKKRKDPNAIRKALKLVIDGPAQELIPAPIAAEVRGVVTAPKSDWSAFCADIERVEKILKQAERIRRERDDEEAVLLLMW